MIDVALTPAGLRRSQVAVVIDVLRATSTATQALAAGCSRVLLVDGLERAAALRAQERVLAGERRCVKPPGFDRGNSPREVRDLRSGELVLATTNGTPAAVAAADRAPTVLLACLLNLDAAIEALRRAETTAGGDVQLVCAGTDGEVALEDVYVAGRLSAALAGPRSDAARVAEAVARAYRTPVDALADSTDAAALRRAGLKDDIADCARISTLDVVPRIVEVDGGVAVATDSTTGPTLQRVLDGGDAVAV